jgi:hypothetical protein
MGSPTWVKTPILDGDREHFPYLDKPIKKAVWNSRPLVPNKVAATILYLYSLYRAEPDFIERSNIILDGGLSVEPSSA